MSKTMLKYAGLAITILLGLCANAQIRQEAGAGRLLLPVKQGGRWGYADTSGNVIIAPQFDAANPFEGKIAVVEKNRKAFAIDSSGKILTPAFDQLEILQDSILAVYLNEVSDTLGGWGIATLSGKLLLNTAYDEVVPVTSQRFFFRRDSLWGAIDNKGTILAEAVYDTIFLNAPYLVLQKGKKFGAVNFAGIRLLGDSFANIFLPDEKIIAAKLFSAKKSVPGKWGAVTNTAAPFIPFCYDSIFRIAGFFVGVKLHDSLGVFFSSTNGGNPTGAHYQKLLPVDLFWLRLVDAAGNCGLADTLGKMIVPVAYRDICIGGNGTWFVSDTSGKWGFYSAEGQLMLPPSFTRIQPFSGKLTVVFNGNLQGLVNDRGEILVAPARQQVLIRGNTVKLLRPDNSAEFLSMDVNGNIVSRSSYDEFRVIRISGKEAPAVPGIRGPAGNNSITGADQAYAAPVDSLDWFFDARQALWGLLNRFTGDTILPAQFSDVSRVNTFVTLVEISSRTSSMKIDDMQTVVMHRYGLVNDTSGAFILHPRYTTIVTADLGAHGFSGYVRTTLPGGQMALVSTDGSERASVYTWIDAPSGGYARVCTGGKWSISEPGENIGNLFSFSRQQSIDNLASYGKAALSKVFMEKSLVIAAGKWGYIDTAGHVVISPQYEGARASQGGTGIVKQGKKWGLIDMQNNSRIPFVYDGLNYLHTDSSTLVVAQTNGIRYGYVDRNGTIRIPADLKQSKQLGYGFIGFSKTGKWGLMNPAGVTLCGENYHEILPFSEGIAAVRVGNKWGYIDTTGAEIIAPCFQKAGPFREGLARVLQNQRWGFTDTKGQLVIEPKFLQAKDFSGDAAPVKMRDGWGLVNREGKFVQPPKWTQINALDSLARGLFVIRSDYLSGLCRSDGKMLLAPRYEGYKFLHEGRIAYRSGNNYGLLDTSGKIITETIFEMIKPFSEGTAPALSGGLWGYINANGHFVIQPQFKVATGFVDHRAYVYNQQTRAQLIDTTGRPVYEIPSDHVLVGYSEGKYLVEKLNRQKEVEKLFYLNRANRPLNRLDFKEATLFKDGAARVRPKGGNTWGLISFTGYYLVRPRFYKLSPFENGLSCFQLRYKVGAFTLEGNPVLPVEYDAIFFEQETGMIRFERGNSLGYLFGDGRLCWPETE